MGRSAMPYRVTLVGALALLALGAGCNESAAPDDTVDVHTIRLVVGEQVVTIEQGGVVAEPLVIGSGDTGLMAQFLDRSGELTPVSPAEYRIEIVPDDEGVVTFTRTTAFAGRLTGVAPGSARLAVCLLHVPSDQCEVGSRTEAVLPVTVDALGGGDGVGGDGDPVEPGTGEGE
ncbi:MAG: hypothetical protein DIU52_001585 [bacterium]|jgi:hypothetical protein